MKKAFLIAAFMMFIAATAYGGAPYVGLFAGVYDPDTFIEGAGGMDHSMCEVHTSVVYQDIEMWIWYCADQQLGLTAGEFKIVYPTSTFVIQGAVTSNPANTVELGSLGAGISWTVGGLNCQYEWYWSHHQTLTLKRITASGFVQIVPDPALVTPPFDLISTSCELGFPIYVDTKLSNLALNQTCQIAVQDKSWGAIKSLYNE